MECLFFPCHAPVVHTASMEMIGGGESIKSRCRTTDVMADAAYTIITRNSRECTGNLFIDEDVLRSAGITDMDQYSIVKDADLMLDFFLLDMTPEELQKQHIELQGYGSEVSTASQVGFVFQQIQAKLSPSLVKQVGASFQFILSGKESGSWFVDLKSGSGRAGKGQAKGADCTLTLASDIFTDVFQGKEDLASTLASENVDVKGSQETANKLSTLIRAVESS